jgi:integrase
VSKLTTARVTKLLRSGSPAKVADGNSLFLIVRRPGVGYWVHQFRDGASFQSKGFGRAPTVTLAQARRSREAFTVGRRSGAAHVSELSERSNAQAGAHVPKALGKSTPRAAGESAGETFGAALLDYVSEKAMDWRGGVRGRTGKDYTALGNGPLASLTWPEITDDVIRAYVAAMPRKGAKDTRKRIELVREFMRTGDIKRPMPKPAHHPAMAYQDLPPFMRELSVIDKPQAKALAFAILTAARIGDVCGTVDKPPATWREVTGDVWEIAGERMKAGEDHSVPLTAQALALLGLRRAADAPLFDIKADAIRKLLKKLRAAITIHGFRATFRTWCGDHGFDRELAEMSLAHAIGDATEQAYQRSGYLARRRVVMEAWAAFANGA